MAFPGFLVLVGAVVIAEIIAPAVVAEDGAMVRSPFDGVFETAAAFAREDLAGNQADTRNSFRGVSPAIPATPMPLLLTAPMMPATWVPWSSGVMYVLLVAKL